MAASAVGIQGLSIHESRDTVEIVREQPGIHIQGHHCRGVAEHPLYDFDICSRSDRQTRRRVAQIVRPQLAEPQVGNRRVKDLTPPVG